MNPLITKDVLAGAVVLPNLPPYAPAALQDPGDSEWRCGHRMQGGMRRALGGGMLGERGRQSMAHARRCVGCQPRKGVRRSMWGRLGVPLAALRCPASSSWGARALEL